MHTFTLLYREQHTTNPINFSVFISLSLVFYPFTSSSSSPCSIRSLFLHSIFFNAGSVWTCDRTRQFYYLKSMVQYYMLCTNFFALYSLLFFTLFLFFIIGHIKHRNVCIRFNNSLFFFSLSFSSCAFISIRFFFQLSNVAVNCVCVVLLAYYTIFNEMFLLPLNLLLPSLALFHTVALSIDTFKFQNITQHIDTWNCVQLCSDYNDGSISQINMHSYFIHINLNAIYTVQSDYKHFQITKFHL